MELIGGIFWLIWIVGFFFIKKSAKQRNRQQRFEQAKANQTKRSNQFTKQVSNVPSELEKHKAREAMFKRNQKTHKSARLHQDSLKKRNVGVQQRKQTSIKGFVEGIQKFQQNSDSMEAYLNEEYHDLEMDPYQESLNDAYSLDSDQDDIDWESYETDLFDDSDWNDDEEILKEVKTGTADTHNVPKTKPITLNASNIKQGIILSEILAKPKSQR